ncbi:MAG: hypothetical protein U9N02_08210 [Campylobacterota bacterium]|nr:hypothetical protein [Campylobacterota bacterium]
MTQKEKADFLSVAPMTLRNWKKYKPNLYEIIMKGFAFNDIIKKTEQNLDELKLLEKEAK